MQPVSEFPVDIACAERETVGGRVVFILPQDEVPPPGASGGSHHGSLDNHLAELRSPARHLGAACARERNGHGRRHRTPTP